MRGARSILILAAVTAVVVGATAFVERERGSHTAERSDEIVFPALLGQVNSVARVRVTGSEGTFNLVRDGDRWVVEEKHRYPADQNRIHELILGAAGLRRLEPKTSNPELYPKLWLEDPTGEDARSVRIVLEDASDTRLASWVLGDRRPSKSDAGRTELYVRVADDPQAWLVEGSVPGGRTIIDWVDRMVASIDRDRLRAAEVVHADGAVVTVDKSLPTDTDFTLRDIPANREVDSQYRINDIGRLLEDLRFEDVTPSSALDFAGSLDKRLQITTFDGLRIRMETVMRDGEAWATLRAEVDEGLVTGAAAERLEATEDSGASEAPEGEVGAEPTANAASKSDADPEPTETQGPTGLLPLDEVQAEAERLKARWEGWAYELPSFKRDYIARRMDELTRALEEADAGTEG